MHLCNAPYAPAGRPHAAPHARQPQAVRGPRRRPASMCKHTASTWVQYIVQYIGAVYSAVHSAVHCIVHAADLSARRAALLLARLRRQSAARRHQGLLALGNAPHCFASPSAPHALSAPVPWPARTAAARGPALQPLLRHTAVSALCALCAARLQPLCAAPPCPPPWTHACQPS